MWCSGVFNLCFLTIFGFFSLTASSHEKHIPVNIGEGFLIRLVDTESSERPPLMCKLKVFESQQEEYFWVPGEKKKFELPSGEVVHPIDFNDTNACGVRVFNAGEESSGKWILNLINMEGKRGLISPVSVFIPHWSKCPNERWNDCRQLSVDNFYLGSCDETLRGTFSYKCDFIGDGQMSRQSVKLTGGGGDSELFTPLKKTNTQSTLLECQATLGSHLHFKYALVACYIEHIPTKTKYLIKEGYQDKRYSAYETDFGRGICQFEFFGGFSEDDAGIWIMTMEAKKRPTNEYKVIEKIKICRFNVKGDETLALEKIVQRTNSTVVVKTTEETVKIECAKGVYYPIKACYLMTQYQDILVSEDLDSLASGNCEFEVSPGNWTCAFNGPTEEDLDFLQKFYVVKVNKVIGGLVKPVADERPVTMKCHLFHKNPMKMCVFVSPSGKMFRLPTDQFKSEEFSYHKGASWEEGNCDITFGTDVELEAGNWKCHIVKLNGEKLSMEIFVPKRGKFGNYAFYYET